MVQRSLRHLIAGFKRYGLLCTSALVTVVGLLLWLYLLRAVPARVAASIQYLQPVFGIAAASALFGDRLGLTFVVGVVLILASLSLAVANKRPAPGAVTPRA